MRSATKAKLDQALRRQWFNRAAVAAGLLMLAGGVLWFTGLDATVKNRQVKGVIETVTPAASMNAQGVDTGLAVVIKLEDGREAKVMTTRAFDPKTGQPVEITEHIHGTGRSTFSWK